MDSRTSDARKPRARRLAPLLAAGLLLGATRAEAGLGLFHRTPKGPYAVQQGPGYGVLSYGPPGPQPGFQGFGLNIHRGYGYGGQGLGTTANGGYPFYGGPGYPHCEPPLRRVGGINPFPFYGGPGGPVPGHPNFYGEPGPLSLDPPVLTIGGSLGSPVEYGRFTGMAPYPESFFAPFTSAAARGDSSTTLSPPEAPPVPRTDPTPAPEAPRR